jgi:hypothetical protein
VIVDTVDPTKHPLIDDQYERLYPEL